MPTASPIPKPSFTRENIWDISVEFRRGKRRNGRSAESPEALLLRTNQSRLKPSEVMRFVKKLIDRLSFIS